MPSNTTLVNIGKFLQKSAYTRKTSAGLVSINITHLHAISWDQSIYVYANLYLANAKIKVNFKLK